jgi:two-component system response regulator YesN
MYKVLIADDELLIQIGLKSIINYDEMGLTLLNIAKNGQEALDRIKDEKPDIIILDIKMPKIDGIGVIERFLAENPYKPEPIFILLTNIDSFDHARSAIRLNVFDYIIKIELNPQILTATLKRAIQYLDNQNRTPNPNIGIRQTILVEKYYQKLLNGWFTNSVERDDEIQELHIDFDYPKYCVMYFILLDRSLKTPEESGRIKKTMYLTELISRICAKYYPSYVTSWNLYSYAAITGIAETKKENKTILEECAKDIIKSVDQFMNIKIAAGIGSFVELSNISISFYEALKAAGYCNTDNTLSFYEKNDCSRNYKVLAQVSSIGEKLTNSISNYQVSEIKAIFQEIETLIQDKDTGIKQAIVVCSGILHYLSVSSHKISRILPDFFSKKSNPYYDLLFLHNIPQLMIWLDDLNENLCAHVREDFAVNRGWLIVNIKQYIEKHYNETFSQTDVAREFDISPGYISTIFKKYNNVGFAECVAQAKIMHAKDLLSEGKMKIYEISDAVGYSDPYYFSKIFKKMTGQSPKDYAAQHRTVSSAGPV